MVKAAENNTIMPQTKKCSCSPIPKPITDFRKRKGAGYGDGYQSKCKECEKKAAKVKPLKVSEKWDFAF